jgi:predicted membrane-bound spermidine synthase
LAAKEMRGQVSAAETNTSLYAFDLFGSALAAFLTPFVLIPLGGTALSQWFAAFLVMGFAIWESFKPKKELSHG